ncbi:Fructose-2,6-bisphosphatase [Tulasnella sp. 330]|nr:Fructose-2,6-bisphosphatase [Tulasnella sp. 330]KAG8885581.1 Fructose-2,6-bisphosphatase [Tulasnella sp. 331]KAG8889915.1 Fructose-2,6-bisphosphatase [Tulasnella sp. 332]
MDTSGTPPDIDLKAVDAALSQYPLLNIPGPTTPGGTITTISVVPMAPTPTHITGSQDQQLSISPTADRNLLLRPAALTTTDSHGPTFYGAKSAALKQFDVSRAATRSQSVAATPPMSVAGIGTKVSKPDYSEAKIVLALVGLPARGKSYLSNKLTRYLQWLEYKVKVFNVGQLRRKRAQEVEQQQGVKENHSAQYFSHSNEDAIKAREGLAEESLEMLITWLKGGGNVGIHDATNSTRSRRAKIAARVAKEPNLVLLFLESLCDDPVIIAANIALKASAGDPDYKGMSKEEAVADFSNRIKQYEAVYETIEPFEWEGMEYEKQQRKMTGPDVQQQAAETHAVEKEKEDKRLKLVEEAAKNPGKDNQRQALVTRQMAKNVSYMKVINVGRQLDIVRVNGYLQSRIAYYLMNLHIKPRSIFMSRHGESQYNVDGRIGGDAPLSARGEMYAKALPMLITDNIGAAQMQVWTSTLQRTIQTARNLPYPKLTWKSLDELDAGVCDGMTYEEIAEQYPDDFANRDEDKFNYRYRGGESYRDVVVRLEPVIMELERHENILVIGHQAIVRCLYAYFHNISQEDLPYINIPLHTVIKLTPKAYGCEEERRVESISSSLNYGSHFLVTLSRYKVPIAAVSTHRPKPKAGGDVQGDPASVTTLRSSARDYYGDKA